MSARDVLACGGVFISEPDADNEPTIWHLVGGDTDQYRYTPILRRCDLQPAVRHHWDDIVARVCGAS